MSSATVAGVPLATIVFGAALIGVLFVFYLFIMSGPGQLLSTAFGVLDQGVASAGLAFNTLLSSSAPIIAQGLAVGGTLIEQAGFVADTIITEAGMVINQALSSVGEFIAVEGALLASSVITLGASVVSITLNITTCIAVMSAELANVFLAAAQATAQFFLSMGVAAAQTATMLIELLTNAAAQMFTSAFTSITGVLGQLASIGLIIFSGATTVAAEYASVAICLGVAGVSVFTNLFKSFVDLFTNPQKFIKIITGIATTIGREITSGFMKLVDAIPNAFKQVFNI